MLLVNGNVKIILKGIRNRLKEILCSLLSWK
jgi:hypothetical protein